MAAACLRQGEAYQQRGELAGAADQYGQALGLLRMALGDGAAPVDAAGELTEVFIEALLHAAGIALARGQLRQLPDGERTALALYTEALAVLDACLGRGGADARLWGHRGVLCGLRGDVLQAMGATDEAAACFAEAAAAARARLTADAHDEGAWRALGGHLSRLATLRFLTRLERRNQAVAAGIERDEHPDTLRQRFDEDPAEARETAGILAVLEEALDCQRRGAHMHAHTHTHTAPTFLHEDGHLYFRDPDDAAAHARGDLAAYLDWVGRLRESLGDAAGAQAALAERDALLGASGAD